ncbi:hypothetical protein GUJ93_ZPchr0012g19092 [Zizania palustris]|uniref:Chromo domain-containing protein n=1 Tax=Zizania palustris TaxID=103762 RepID=A0A8J6BNJ7_ZIZPA|nr:hypothetical protein GUJ93_ZPchr0012g19092 [Zizania palustris]
MVRVKNDSGVTDGARDPEEEEEEEEVPAAVLAEVDEEEVGEEQGEEREEEEEEEDDWEEGEEVERDEESGQGAAEDSVQEEAAVAAAAAAEHASPPKLAEGFYEIEDIRRRRLRKGQLQYLVKWRGWPESANTWEPLENLWACSDIIDAFEKRSRSPRSCRKRKRKITTTPVTGSNPSHGKRGRPPRSDAQSSRPPAPEAKKQPCRSSSRRSSSKTLVAELDASAQNGVQVGSSSGGISRAACQELPLTVRLTDQQNEHQLLNGHENPVLTPPSQGGQVTGAKKRKSGNVRRFEQNKPTQEHGECGAVVVEDAGSTEGEIGYKNRMEGCAIHAHITKIIKPVRFAAVMNNDVQQVSITFKALRIDLCCQGRSMLRVSLLQKCTAHAIAIPIKLDGHNYREWAFSVKTVLIRYALASHLTDAPPIDKSTYGSGTGEVKT